MSNGVISTLKTSESLKTGSACSLSDILEENPDEKYFLSQETVNRLMGYEDTFLQTL